MADVQQAAEKKPVRGRPFSKTNQPGRERPDALAEQDFGQLARLIITDRRAQRALMARARRGDLPAHVIALLAQSAAPAPAPARTAPTAGEVAACLAASVPPFIQRLMYDHARGRLDDQGRPTERPKAKAEKKAKAKARAERAPRPEPELQPDQPLAAARDRLEAEERGRRAAWRSEAVEIDLSGIPDPEPTREELRAMGRVPRGEEDHDWRDVAHRAECRACRATWRRDGAARTRFDR